MEMILHMVGYYETHDITLKNIPFVNGVGRVQGADELVGNVCKYLRTFGAFPLHEAEELRAAQDKAAGKTGDMRRTKARLEKAKLAVAEAEAEMEEGRMALEERLAEEDRQNGTVQDHITSEGRGSKQAGRPKNSKSKGNEGQ